ncbi:MAG: hypothetical protein AB7U82_03830 [Blastocatellales bacterium]
MKRIALIMAFLMLAAIAVAAQDKPKTDAPKADAAKTDTKAAALPTVDDVLDKFVKAIGGKEAVEKATSRSMKGSFDIEAMNMTGTFEMIAKAPNKSAVKIDLPGFGVVNNVYDGTKAWSADPMQGLRELSGAELAAMKRRSDFYAEINYKKHYSKMEVKGKEKVGSYETYVIEATPVEGGPEKLYFDANTGLLVRHDMEVESPQGKMATESYMDDYKVVDGVKVAHLMKQVNPMIAWSMKITEIKTNVPVDDAKFNKPAN